MMQGIQNWKWKNQKMLQIKYIINNKFNINFVSYILEEKAKFYAKFLNKNAKTYLNNKFRKEPCFVCIWYRSIFQN